jgi:hypothetical protein
MPWPHDLFWERMANDASPPAAATRRVDYNGDILYDLDDSAHPIRWRYAGKSLIRIVVYQSNPRNPSGWCPVPAAEKGLAMKSTLSKHMDVSDALAT